MKQKKRNPNFDLALETLRAHRFEVTPVTDINGGVLVAKYGAAAVLVAGKDTPIAYAELPGAYFSGEVAQLVDRGYQKFLKTSNFELPATASHLHSIHRYCEELKQLTGAISLYNESLGTTSAFYRYDRLRGRETAQPVPARPWDGASEH